MKLFIYDEKHEQIIGELDLGLCTDNTIATINNIIEFLHDKGITNRYKELVIAESYEIKSEDGEPLVVFTSYEITEI